MITRRQKAGLIKNPFSRVFLLAAAAALACGCGGFKNPPKQVHSYILSYQSGQNAADDFPAISVLGIKPFKTASLYRTEKMVYSDNPYTRSTYVYHRWAYNPAEMVENLLTRDLRKAKAAGAVVSMPDPRATHVLEATINEFYEDDSGDQWKAVLEITVALYGSKAGQQEASGDIVMSRTYRCEKTMEKNNPLALARAMSAALREVSASMIKDLSKKTGTKSS
ncbi:MAG: ABC-type transport auxiliary lipoprotein family protein [Desulfosalsimonas sp.]